MILPPVYFDKEAMFDHHFLERNEQFLHYQLIYDRRNVVPVTLLAPYLFDFRQEEGMFSPGKKPLNMRGEWRQLANTLLLRMRSPLISVQPQFPLWISARRSLVLDQLRPKA